MPGDGDLLMNAARATQACIDCMRNDRKILLAGNGGSAADAQHVAGQLASRFAFDRPRCGLAENALHKRT